MLSYFKEGSRNEFEYYRPGNLISVISRLLETQIKNHMVDFLTKHELINRSQQAKSCLTNLLCLR